VLSLKCEPYELLERLFGVWTGKPVEAAGAMARVVCVICGFFFGGRVCALALLRDFGSALGFSGPYISADSLLPV
jgi:hypothetical protein